MGWWAPGAFPEPGHHSLLVFRIGPQWGLRVHPSSVGLAGSLVTQLVKNQPARRETLVQSLGREDPLEKGMATHSSILAWRISWTEESGRSSPWGHKESDTTEGLTHTR